MATEIKPAPVLMGKAARDFYKSLRNQPPIKESREELQARLHNFQKFLSKQKHLQPTIVLLNSPSLCLHEIKS